jgi:hypothetical protein
LKFGYNSRVSQVSTGTSIGKPVIRGLSGNRVLVYSQGVRMENQQFGDEHGLGLNDAGVESVEVIKDQLLSCMVQMPWVVFCISTQKNCGCTILLKPILIKIILKYARK